MEIVPLVGSIILKRAKLKLDLPAPVRPTMPTCRKLPNFFNKSVHCSPFRCPGHQGWSSPGHKAIQVGTWWHIWHRSICTKIRSELLRTHQTWSLLLMASSQPRAPQTPNLPPEPNISVWFCLLAFCCGTCGRSSYSRTLSRATLSDSSSPAILMTILMILIYFQPNIRFQPDCPTKPVDHLHCIGDRESDYPRA